MNWVFGELAFSLIGFRQIAHSVTGLLENLPDLACSGKRQTSESMELRRDFFFLYINWGPAVKCSSVQAELT